MLFAAIRYYFLNVISLLIVSYIGGKVGIWIGVIIAVILWCLRSIC
jgi:hypothetical protein